MTDSLVTRYYVGPFAYLDTKLDGRRHTLKRGESVQVSEAEAALLDAQPSNWAVTAPGTSEPVKTSAETPGTTYATIPAPTVSAEASVETPAPAEEPVPAASPDVAALEAQIAADQAALAAAKQTATNSQNPGA